MTNITIVIDKTKLNKMNDNMYACLVRITSLQWTYNIIITVYRVCHSIQIYTVELLPNSGSHIYNSAVYNIQICFLKKTIAGHSTKL